MSFRRKQRKSLSQRSSKIQREEIEDSSTTVKVSQASTATIAGEIVNINPNLPSPALAIKLNRLKGKSARYTSQKDFLSSSLTTNFFQNF